MLGLQNMQLLNGIGGPQHSHTQVERPLIIPDIIPIAELQLPTNHPLAYSLNQIRYDIAKNAANEVARQAGKNPLRIYMWNQISYNGFNNIDMLRLVMLIVDKILLDTYQYGNNIESTQFLEIIRADISQGCELFAAINAIQKQPMLMTAFNSESILKLNSMAEELRIKITHMKANLQTGRGVDISSGLGGMGNYGTGIPTIKPGGDLDMLGSLANIGIGGEHVLGGSGVSYAGVSNVTSELQSDFGVIDNMDNLISENLPLPTAEKSVSSASQVQVNKPIERLSFRDVNGDQLELIDDNHSNIAKIMSKFVPNRNKQFFLEAFHPSYQKIGIFENKVTGTRVVSVYGEKTEMDREKHYRAGQVGLPLGIVIPPALLEESFTIAASESENESEKDIVETENTKRIDLEDANLIQHNEVAFYDTLEAAIKFTQNEVLLRGTVFAVKQQAAIGEALYLMPAVRKIVYEVFDDKEISMVKVLDAINQSLKIIRDAKPAATIEEDNRLKATFRSLDIIETAITESVNNALCYNLGISKNALNTTSVLEDWEALVGIVAQKYSKDFSETMIKHEAEIILRAVELVPDTDLASLANSQFMIQRNVFDDLVHTAIPLTVTAMNASASSLDIETIGDLPMVVPTDDSGFLTFIKNICNKNASSTSRVYLATLDGLLFEIHRPWMVPDNLESYVISKVTHSW